MAMAKAHELPLVGRVCAELARGGRSLHRDEPPASFRPRSPASSSVSPSSLQSIQTTDSDSLPGEQPAGQQMGAALHQTQGSAAPPGKSRARSPPVLIKYNYYDYNGERQENLEMNSPNGQQQQAAGALSTATKPIQRQLSPAFKQSLDQIVRSSQQRLMGATSPTQADQPQQVQESARTSPTREYTITLLARRYKLSSYEHRCLRCAKTVYQMDKVGPLKDFTFYHQNCFKCRECGTKLTLKTYFNNQHSSTDLEVYCNRHCPKTPAGKLDNQSVGIRAALNAPKVFDPTHQQALLSGGPLQHLGQHQHPDQQPQVDSRALHIQHAVQQTRLQAIYKQSQVDKKISQFLNRRLEFLEPKQKMLEARHREEEEQLFKVFEQKWRQEERHIREQIRDEWQAELNKLLDKYRRQLSANLQADYSAQGGDKATKIPFKKQNINQLSNQVTRNNNNNNDSDMPPPPPPLQRIDFHQVSARKAAAAMAVGGQPPPPLDAANEQRMIELERMNLEKTMTIKLDRKKETLKRKLREFERQATAELVEKQSREMLTLISLKLEEFKEEQKRKIGSDLEHFEAIESLANRLGASLQVAPNPTNGVKPTSGQVSARQATAGGLAAAQDSAGLAPEVPPPPRAPLMSKMELYNSEQADEMFREIDELAINVAREDQRTFTDLVHHLTRHCLTDVEKVRAIFRWITVKNLNTMQFDDATIKPDTPLGLLRGIKQGSESYHVLFKRLCSYAGLHCVVIKGYSKSAGYQPGVRFESNRFRNSWNAVYVAGAWRFVQCNWGARHLVSVAVMQDKGSEAKQPGGKSRPVVAGSVAPASPVLSSSSYSSGSSSSCPSPSGCVAGPGGGRSQQRSREPSSQHQQMAPVAGAVQRRQQQVAPSSDSLRYEYDDHYFLTDPDEFIYEFFPLAPEWQLLRSRPISLTEFEQLPFVRSLFFKYGLYFPQPDIRAVLHTNSSGATTIKIGMPTHMVPSLIFHYNLKHFDSDLEHHDDVSLKRFVMQSVESGGGEGQTKGLSNVVSFRVHVPEDGAYILDIFANSTTPSQYITGEPMKFKSVCKFKIVAKNLRTVMVPLPDCASGEYGPMKATRLFGIIPLTHESGLVSVHNDKRFLELQFRMTRPLLDFMASLHKNGHDERQLSKLIKIFIDGDIVFVAIKFLEDGQYGLDLYTRDQSQEAADDQRQPNPKKQLLTHCCKYLINVRAGSASAPSFR